MSGHTKSDGERVRHDLCVVFEIEVPPGGHCPMGEFSGDIEEVRQQLVNGECHTDTKVSTDECVCAPEQECTEVVHETRPIGATCPCAVFGEFNCVPRLLDATGECIHVETYLPDRDRLGNLVSALREVTNGLRLRQLKRIDTAQVERNRNTATLDLFDVTEKQREAVTKAVTAGYYSRPRETSLEELADDHDISRSALSQRLNAVESKLATAAFRQASIEG